jgi:hypothetical protein
VSYEVLTTCRVEKDLSDKHSLSCSRERRAIIVQSRNDRAAAWERYLEAEWRNLQLRQEEQLAKMLGSPLPGETPQELERLRRTVAGRKKGWWNSVAPASRSHTSAWMILLPKTAERGSKRSGCTANGAGSAEQGVCPYGDRRGELHRTPSIRSSQNLPSTQLGE